MVDIAGAALFAYSTTITPGPNNIMVMTSTMNFGIKQSMPHYLGIAFGFPAMMLAIGMGLGKLFTEIPLMKTVLTAAGVTYMLYLAIKLAQFADVIHEGETAPHPFTFFQAAFFQWVNPKAWVMSISAFSIFYDTAATNWLQTLTLPVIFMSSAFVCVGCWVFLGSKMHLLIRNRKHMQWFNRTMAVLMVASMVPAIIGI